MFPYPQIVRQSFFALEAHKDKVESLKSPYETGLWITARDEPGGVTRHESDRTYGHYTFYTSGHTSGAFLRDMEGNLMHEWRLPFGQAWSDPPHVDNPPPESLIYWRRAHLYRNGDVLALYSTVAGSPYGYGLVKIDRDSEVLWRYPEHVHHDFDLTDEGTIYTLVHKNRSTAKRPVPGVPQYPPLILEEYLVELSPGGHERNRINLLELLAESKYRHLLQMYDPRKTNPVRGREPWDIMHANGVEIVGDQFAEAHEFVDAGDVLVSFRALDTIIAVDIDREAVTWASRGFWRAQHDPDALANGDLLVFDNRGDTVRGGRSRILQFDPTSRAASWRYRGTADEPFDSERLGSQQVLPNGNLLITSSAEGRLLEVTPRGRIVWEYKNRVEFPNGDSAYRPVTFGATRFSKLELLFEFDGQTTEAGGQ
ncbi:MAG: arylsulfotransferase family protein [Bradymonadaceae bacterium]